MADQKSPNQSSGMEPAEGSRETAESNLREQDSSAGGTQSGGGITNRPIDEEIENQRDLPPRGEARKPDRPLVTPDELDATPPHGDVTPPHER